MTPDSTRPDVSVLARYLSGESSAAEAALVRRWAERDVENERELAEMARVWATPSIAPERPDLDAMWARVRRTMRPSGGPRRAVSPAVRNSWIAPLLTLSVCVLAVVALGYAVVRFTAGGGRGVVGREYATAPGERASVILSDGTKLVLGPDSHVQLPADFGRETRTVQLEGEAYFTVVHDPMHPFLVHTRGIVTRDVGTAFNIRSYREDSVTTVAVAAGAVTVSRDRCPSAGACDTALTRGDVIRVSDDRFLVARGADVAVLTAWMQGQLVFDRTPLVDVARELSRAFGVRIVVADSTLAHVHITGTYSSESPDQVLDAITRSAGAQYQRTDRTIVIRRRAASVLHPVSHALAPLTTARANIDRANTDGLP